MKLILRIYLLLTFLNFLSVFKSSAQDLKYDSLKVFSKGIIPEGKSRSILELKVVETDPILKLAKETVPFDRVFFIKLKRPSRGKNVEISATTIKKTDSTETLKPSPNLEVKNSVSREFKGPLEKEKTIKLPSKIFSISLRSSQNKSITTISNKVYPSPDGKVYEDNSSSEFVYIEMPNLRPDQGYDLKISWTDSLNRSDEIYSFTTIPTTLEKRLKQQVIPQLSVASPIFKYSKNNYSLEPTLMIGFYIHPRSIDPDIPFYNYSYFSLQRFSYFAGLTINSIAEENVRGDLIGTSNIMVGIGYQPFNAIRVSYGVLFFNEINPNRLMLDRKSLAATSYVALTIDIKLKDILGGIVTTLGFK